MTNRTPNRKVKINTNLAVSSGFGGFEDNLTKELSMLFDEDEELREAVSQILDAVLAYDMTRKVNRSRPSRNEQEEDMQQLVDTLDEAVNRLTPWHFPPDAKPILEQRRHGKELLDGVRSNVFELLQIMRTITLPESGFPTNPGKKERDQILIPRLLHIFDKYMGEQYKGGESVGEVVSHTESEEDRKKAEVDFISVVFDCFHEKVPKDLFKVIRNIRKTMPAKSLPETEGDFAETK
jgi:hypothetical protein